MSIKDTKMVICDRCERAHEYEDNSYISMDFSYLGKTVKNLDFCSQSCAIRWIGNTSKVALNIKIDEELDVDCIRM